MITVSLNTLWSKVSHETTAGGFGLGAILDRKRKPLEEQHTAGVFLVLFVQMNGGYEDEFYMLRLSDNYLNKFGVHDEITKYLEDTWVFLRMVVDMMIDAELIKSDNGFEALWKSFVCYTSLTLAANWYLGNGNARYCIERSLELIQ